MLRRTPLFQALLLLVLFLNGPLRAAGDCHSQPNGLERGVLDQLNLARQDPPGYAFHLEDLRDAYRGKDRKIGPGSYVMTKEGVPAVDEAIRVLKATTPRQTLRWDSCLSESASAHVNDTGPLGLVGHEGSKGETFAHRVKRYVTHYRQVGENIDYGATTAADVVIQLLVDDGVPDRGHRHNIFEPGFNAAGVACGPHAKYGTMCVIDFARQ